MMEKNGLLKSTELGNKLHRVYFEVGTTDTWYAIMREARALYGTNWKCQGHVRKKLERWAWHNSTGIIAKFENIWFEVPDPKFTTWISMKLAVRTVGGKNK